MQFFKIEDIIISCAFAGRRVWGNVSVSELAVYKTKDDWNCKFVIVFAMTVFQNLWAKRRGRVSSWQEQGEYSRSNGTGADRKKQKKNPYKKTRRTVDASQAQNL